MRGRYNMALSSDPTLVPWGFMRKSSANVRGESDIADEVRLTCGIVPWLADVQLGHSL